MVNTAPARLLGREQLAALRPGALVIDLASKPAAWILKRPSSWALRAVWALSLAGKVAPGFRGGYMKTAIYHIMDELGE